MATESKYPWATIITGFIVLVITVVYYYIISHAYIIYYSTVDIFEWYGWTVIVCGTILTIWAYLKQKVFSRIWLVTLVLFINILTIFYFNRLLEPMPSQFRFSLSNHTNQDLKQLRVVGYKVNEEIRIDNLKKGKTINFIYKDNTDEINLIYKLENNKIDTLNLGLYMSESCGYYFDINLKMDKGRLMKD